MSNENHEYRTGQGVPETGEYLCQSGEKAIVTKGDTFPTCPETGKNTTWQQIKQA